MSTNADGTAWGICAAYGCPLLGTVGNGGKWFCFCHSHANHALNDAITAEINRNRPLVDEILLLRASGGSYADLRAIEAQLLDLTREIGQQIPIPAAPVTGPTSGQPHFAEVDA